MKSLRNSWENVTVADTSEVCSYLRYINLLLHCLFFISYLHTMLSTNIKQYIKLYFNRAKLLTKIHDGEVKSQNYQVSEWLILPSTPPPVLLMRMKGNDQRDMGAALCSRSPSPSLRPASWWARTSTQL